MGIQRSGLPLSAQRSTTPQRPNAFGPTGPGPSGSIADRQRSSSRCLACGHRFRSISLSPNITSRGKPKVTPNAGPAGTPTACRCCLRRSGTSVLEPNCWVNFGVVFGERLSRSTALLYRCSLYRSPRRRRSRRADALRAAMRWDVANHSEGARESRQHVCGAQRGSQLADRRDSVDPTGRASDGCLYG